MKRLFLLSLLVLFFPSLLPAQSKGVAVEEVEGKKYAILIGVNDYEQLLKLRYARNDIEALRDELYKIGFEKPNVYTLTCGGTSNDRPTKRNIEVIIEHVLDEAKDGDVVLISMSGHGIETDGQARFCPIEAAPNNLQKTTIPINDIFDAFSKSQASLKLMLVDACRENPTGSRSVTGVSALQTLADPPKGVMLFQSSAQGELSYESTELQRGIFSHYFIEGLQGKAANKEGQVTLLGLASYTTARTRQHALDQFRERQRPYLRGEITDFVLASDPHRELREKVMADYLAGTKSLISGMEVITRTAPTKFSYWKEAAELGIPEAQVLCGICYMGGRSVPRETDEAARWFRKAADKGNEMAQFHLGQIYFMTSPSNPDPKDDAEAIKWYLKAAERGHTMAQLTLGNAYTMGRGVPVDRTEANKWYLKAAEQCHKDAEMGEVDAQWILGTMYQQGQGVPKDEAKGFKWYHKAAEQGNVMAMSMLAQAYSTGQGVPKDEAEGTKWQRKAAEAVKKQYGAP